MFSKCLLAILSFHKSGYFVNSLVQSNDIQNYKRFTKHQTNKSFPSQNISLILNITLSNQKWLFTTNNKNHMYRSLYYYNRKISSKEDFIWKKEKFHLSILSHQKTKVYTYNPTGYPSINVCKHTTCLRLKDIHHNNKVAF